MDNDKIYAGFNVPNTVASFDLDGTNRQTELTNGNNTRIFYFSRDGRWTYGLYFDASIHTTAIRLFYDKAPITGFNIPITGFTGNARDQNHGVGIVRRGDEFIILSSNQISRYSLTGKKLGEADDGLGSQYNYIGGFTIGTNRIYAAISSTRTIHYWDFNLKHLGSFSINAPAPDISGLGYNKGKLYLLVNHKSDDHFKIQPITVTEFDNPTSTLSLPDVAGTVVGADYYDDIAVLEQTTINNVNATWLNLYDRTGTKKSRNSVINTEHIDDLASWYDPSDRVVKWYGHDATSIYTFQIEPFVGNTAYTVSNKESGDQFQGVGVIAGTAYLLAQDKLYAFSNLSGSSVAGTKINLSVKRDWAGMTSDGKRLYLLEEKSNDEITKVYVFDPNTTLDKATDGRVRLAEIEIGKLEQEIKDIFYKDGSLYLGYDGDTTAEFIKFEIKDYPFDYDIQYNNNQKLLATDGQYNFTTHEGKITRVGKHTRNTKDLVTLGVSHIATNSITLKRTITLTYPSGSGSPNALGNKDGKLYVFSRFGYVFEVDPETTTQSPTRHGSLGQNNIGGAVWDGERWVVTDRTVESRST